MRPCGASELLALRYMSPDRPTGLLVRRTLRARGGLPASTRVYLRLQIFDDFLMSSWYPNSFDFGANLAPTWAPTWAQNRSKIVPRALRNPSQIASCFRSLLGSILDRFLVDFRPQNWSKINQKTINKSFQQHINKKSKNYKKRRTIYDFSHFGHAMLSQQINKKRPNIHQKTPLKSTPQLGSILAPTWLHFGRFWEPKWGQVGTKLLQNSIFKSIKKLITFQIALGTDFDRFWAPKWAPIGWQNFHFLASFSLLGPSWG